MNIGIVINKDKDMTSRDVVNKLSHILNIKKIGHTGTLDPMATGVLVCLTNKYTKLVDLITNEDKEYIATIKFGIKTDTDDITGNILESISVKEYNKQDIIEVLNNLIGIYEEEIPIYSAVHVNGKRLYEYARNNEDVELPKRKVDIKEIEFLDYHNDLLKFRVVVSKGTYIRSLIQTICKNLNTIGTMNNLIRTRQGKFKIENSYTLNDIANNNYQILNLTDMLDIKIKSVTNILAKKIINGNKLEMNEKGFVLFQDKGCDIALYYFENKIGKLKILF